MCGRYQVSMEEDILEIREILDEINERYKNTSDLSTMKTGEIFPTDTAPVLVSGAGSHEAKLMKWGFPKFQAKGVVINARAETATEKRMFNKSLLERRCVIPTTGFYEWRQEDGKKKTKYLFRADETYPLYLAGFYNSFWEDNQRFDAYTIITTEANHSIAAYHDRMPLILGTDSLSQWLADTKYALEYIHKPCETILKAKAV